MRPDPPLTWFGLVARNLLRRPWRSGFTVLGVALAIASYVALTGLARGMAEGGQASHHERGVDLIVTDRAALEIFGGSLPEALAPQIRRQPGVADVAVELDSSMELTGGVQAIVVGWRLDEFNYRELTLRRGRPPRPGERSVAIGEDLAEAAGLDLGDEVELSFTPFRVVGVTRYESGYLRRMAVMPIQDLQDLLARSGQATHFQVRLRQPGDPEAREAARTGIAALRPNLNVSSTAEAMRTNRLVRMIDASSLAISIVALAIGCLSVLNTMAMGVEERTRELGILASIGWSRQRILALILSEGFILAAVGGALGVALGWVGHTALIDFVTPGGRLSAWSAVDQVARAVAVALVVGLLGALAPAWRASRLAPAAALRRQ
jgi:putative ABC transport system permease protein